MSGYLLGEHRFTFVAGSMLSAAVVFEVLVPAFGGTVGPIAEHDGGTSGGLRSAAAAVWSSGGLRPAAGTVWPSRRLRTVLVVSIVVVASVIVGGAYAGSALHTAHQSSATLPQTVDTADREAMAWMQANTDPDASVVVLGDAGEWVPYYTQRTSLITPWGTEWEGSQRFQYHLNRYTALSECQDASCLDRELSAVDTVPEYLYVPKGHYTIRGAEVDQSARMSRSLKESSRYGVVFENDGVIIVRVRYPQGRR
jgi:hypothetical protein